MTFSTCPIAIVAAPVEQVWRLLANPARYAEWWDAETLAIVPEGPAQPGQIVYARSIALGRRWPVTTIVEAVDEQVRRLDLATHLPLGITVHNHIRCSAVDRMSCRVAFG